MGHINFSRRTALLLNPVSRKLKVALVAAALLVPALAQAQVRPVPGPCVPGALPGGALSLICVPSAGWNGELVVFAHGYVDARQPLDFYHLNLPDGTPLPALVQSLGYAFATTSYRQNGLAILEGVADIRALVAAFATATHSVPLKTHLAGVSEGGLVVALLAERWPELFTSALATCGPIGSFALQVDYFGDFRVLFDYFFPGVIPGSPIEIPADVMARWDTFYVPRIAAALAARPHRAVELMRAAKASYDPAVLSKGGELSKRGEQRGPINGLSLTWDPANTSYDRRPVEWGSVSGPAPPQQSCQRRLAAAVFAFEQPRNSSSSTVSARRTHQAPRGLRAAVNNQGARSSTSTYLAECAYVDEQ